VDPLANALEVAARAGDGDRCVRGSSRGGCDGRRSGVEGGEVDATRSSSPVQWARRVVWMKASGERR
jgi:hypothetical protein